MEEKDKICEILSKMTFKKKFIGGVDPLDVWKKIEVLQREYERLYELQAQKYEAIISNLSDKDKNNE